MKLIFFSLIILFSWTTYSKTFSTVKEKPRLITQLAKKSLKAKKSAPIRKKASKSKKRLQRSRTGIVYKKVKNGETLFSLLKRYKFSTQQRRNILHSRKLPRPFFLSKNEIYRVNYKTRPHGLQFFNLPNNQSISFSANKKGWAIIRKRPLKLTTKIKTVNGEINGSLIQSIQKKIKDEIMPFRFRDAYVHDFNIKKEIKRGAKYSITYEKKYLRNQFIKYGEILKTTLQIKGKINERHFVKSSFGGSFVEKKDSKNKPFFSPVNYQHLTSLFKNRKHPITKRYVSHQGIDYALPKGDPIFSVANGTIKRFGRTRAAGKYVVIQHKNQFESFYNHLSSHSKKLFVGKKVQAGDEIGKNGCTGLCTKAHLHFALKKRGRFVNPLPRYMKSYSYHHKIFIKRFWSSSKAKKN